MPKNKKEKPQSNFNIDEYERLKAQALAEEISQIKNKQLLKRINDVQKINWWPNEAYVRDLIANNTNFSKITGKVYYMASGADMTPIAFFNNAKEFVYHSLMENHSNIYDELRKIEQKGVITNLSSKEEKNKSIFKFNYQGKEKQIKFIFGDKGDLTKKKNIPNIKVDAIHEVRFFGHNLWDSRKALSNVLPTLKIGGTLFGSISPFIITKKANEGMVLDEVATNALITKCGLNRKGNIFVKVKNLSANELEKILNIPKKKPKQLTIRELLKGSQEVVSTKKFITKK